MRQRKTIPVHRQTDQDLLAVRTVVARVAALGLGVCQRTTLKKGRGHIVQEYGLIQIKQSSLALGEGGFDGDTLGMQPVQVSVECIFSQGLEIDL